jgi:hypothetical protein
MRSGETAGSTRPFLIESGAVAPTWKGAVSESRPLQPSNAPRLPCHPRVCLGPELNRPTPIGSSWRQGGRLELWPAFYGVAWSRLGWRADCGSQGPVVTAGARCPPRCTGSACTWGVPPATSAGGAGLLRVQIAHRALDEVGGFGGRRAWLRLHQSLDDPTEAQTLDAQPIAHDLAEPQQLPSEAAARTFGGEAHRPCFGHEGCRGCRCGGQGGGGIRRAVGALLAAARAR